jgi:2,3-bisphosphoglycerate-dependent phosphoglycerate mutase
MSLKVKALTVYLLRHAHPVPLGTIGFEENERPLSARGLADAERIAADFTGHIDALYSSPYLRARQTIEPLARRRNLAVETIDDLRERLLSAAPLDDWCAHLQRSWTDFDYAPAGGESSRAAQVRVLAVIEHVRARHPEGGAVILASHGNLIARALHAFDSRIDFAFWEAIPTPALFKLELSSNQWRIDC